MKLSKVNFDHSKLLRGISMNRSETKACGLMLWGSMFALAYLYIYEISLAIMVRPTPLAIGHIFELRNGENVGWIVGSIVSRILQSLSFPMHAVGRNLFPSEPYFDACIYLPFTSAAQWFLYGGIFGWWRRRRLVRLMTNSPPDQ
jgi:hypothetical protein